MKNENKTKNNFYLSIKHMLHTSTERYHNNKRVKKDEIELISFSLWKKRISRERKKIEKRDKEREKEKQEDMESLLFSQSFTSLCNMSK